MSKENQILLEELLAALQICETITDQVHLLGRASDAQMAELQQHVAGMQRHLEKLEGAILECDHRTSGAPAMHTPRREASNAH